MNSSQNPNPYSTPLVTLAELSRPRGVGEAAWTLGGFGALIFLMAAFNIVFWGLVPFDANPLFPADEDLESNAARLSMANYQIAIAFVMLIQGALMVVGGWHLLKGRKRGWVIGGAIASIFPPSGFCVFPAIAGSWTLILLRRSDLIKWFA